ncbi:TPA: glycosyltransferase family 4 protein [Streptococcus suis]
MKILYITTISNTLNAFLVPHIDELKKAGHTVDIACKLEQPLSQELINSTREFFELQFNRSLIKNDFFGLIRQVRQLVRQEEYDIVHTHTPIASAVVRFACKSILNTRIFYTAHGFHFLKGGPFLNWLIYYPIERILSSYTDTLITINHEDYAIAKKNFKMKNIFLLNGVGIDTERFHPINDEEKRKLKRTLGFDENKKYLIFVGELNANKNQAVLIEMMDQLSKKRRDLVLLLVGHGSHADMYHQAVKEKQLEASVRLLGYRSDVPDLMKLSEIALSSSKREGLPVNLIEAMATGLPLVVSNCRGNRDLVETGKNGIVLKELTAEDFANAVELVIDDGELYKGMKLSSLERIKEYTIDVVNTRLMSIYEEANFDEKVE